MKYKDIGKYIVYTDGRVYSKISNKFMKHCMTKAGYYMLGSKLGSVHRLVAKTFIGDIPLGMEVNHIDGDKTNNDLSNLEIVTKSENLKHAFQIGIKTNLGSRNAMSKLTEPDVEKICELLLSGYDNESIASLYSLHPRYVSLIRGHKRWGHITEKYGKFPKSNKSRATTSRKA